MTSTDTRTYNVPDISCGHCVSAITEQVTAVAHVTSVNVDLDSKTVTVTGGGDGAIVAAIDEAGFDIA